MISRILGVIEVKGGDSSEHGFKRTRFKVFGMLVVPVVVDEWLFWLMAQFPKV